MKKEKKIDVLNQLYLVVAVLTAIGFALLIAFKPVVREVSLVTEVVGKGLVIGLMDFLILIPVIVEISERRVFSKNRENGRLRWKGNLRNGLKKMLKSFVKTTL